MAGYRIRVAQLRVDIANSRFARSFGSLISARLNLSQPRPRHAEGGRVVASGPPASADTNRRRPNARGGVAVARVVRCSASSRCFAELESAALRKSCALHAEPRPVRRSATRFYRVSCAYVAHRLYERSLTIAQAPQEDQLDACSTAAPIVDPLLSAVFLPAFVHFDMFVLAAVHIRALQAQRTCARPRQLPGSSRGAKAEHSLFGVCCRRAPEPHTARDESFVVSLHFSR